MFYKTFGKRFLDFLIVFIAVITLSPLIILVTFLIKCFDPGPIIFKQDRIGENGRKFKFYKFRSMPVNTGDKASDEIGQVKITWVGKVLRRTNIDELPQLFNVLKGDMSIVGPRPPILSQVELIELRRENGALQCLPGLTGLAQVSSFDGMTVSEKAYFDGEYANNLSFYLDLRIILNTFFYLLRPPPVY